MPSKPASETPQDSGLVPQGERWRFGDFELDEPRRELRRHGELIEVEKKPLNLLMVFLRHPGQLLTKNDLLEAVWPGRIVVEAVLGNAVAKLRDALGDAGAVWLKTVFGFGYRFDAPVERITDDNGAVAPPRLSFNVGDVPPGRPNWQLVSRLGLSGDSWLAEHVKTKARRVFKFTSEPLGLSALKREVTVFRLLRESVGEKACYVDVLDWNFDEPPWFIEAEYCPGGSLQEWFNQQGGIRNVPLEVRLDLIAQIAEALAEIHIVGILHKDLKPANVFVVINADGKPTIRLGDFGSSRLVDATRIAALEITRMGFTQVIDAGSDTSTGTPLYFAPEVLAGQPVTVKADIYALGVMLYQFVVGNISRRLDAGWESNVHDEILREDIGVAANGNSERRLADALELARRIRSREQRQTVLEEQRAAQRLKELQERKRDFVKARRIGLLLAAASLVLGMFGTSIFALRAERARVLAEGEANRARVVGEFLAGGLFASINGDVRQVRSMTVKELVDRAAEKIPQQFENQTEVQADLHFALGSSYDVLEYNAEAEDQLIKAQTLYRSIHGLSDKKILAIASKRIALNYGLGKLQDVLPEFAALSQEASRVLGKDTKELLDFNLELARAELFLGNYVESAVGAAAIVEATEKSDIGTNVAARRVQGLSLLELDDYSAAEDVLTTALQREGSLRKTSKAYMSILCNLASVDIEMGRADAATEKLTAARKIADEWLRSGSGWDNVISIGFARVDFLRGNHERAVSEVSRIIAKIEADTGGTFDQSGFAVAYLADFYIKNKSFDSAEMVLKPLLDSMSKTLPTTSLKLIKTKMLLAIAAGSLNRNVDQTKLLEEIVVPARAKLQKNSPLMMRIDSLLQNSETRIADSSALKK